MALRPDLIACRLQSNAASWDFAVVRKIYGERNVLAVPDTYGESVITPDTCSAGMEKHNPLALSAHRFALHASLLEL